MALIREQVAEVDLFVAGQRVLRGVHGDYLGIPPKKIRTVPLGITVDDLRRRRAAAA